MHSVILVIHIMLALAITILVLLQRSEGDALGGLGGGQGASGLLTGRQTSTLLTKMTSGLFICFIVTSLSLVILAKQATAVEKPILVPVANQEQAG